MPDAKMEGGGLWGGARGKDLAKMLLSIVERDG